MSSNDMSSNKHSRYHYQENNTGTRVRHG